MLGAHVAANLLPNVWGKLWNNILSISALHRTYASTGSSGASVRSCERRFNLMI
jgi:hypothetical protein